MDHAQYQPAFPLARTVGLLAATAALASLATWLILPLFFAGVVTLDQTLALCASVVFVSSILGVLPVAMLGPLGVMATVTGYFIGAAVRGLMCLAAVVVAVRGLRFEPGPVAVCLVVLYLPLLFVEAALVARYLWHKDLLPRPAADTGSSTEALA